MPNQHSERSNLVACTEQRSRNMSRIRGTNTKPEMIVRRYLWGHGFRYRLNHKRLPGKPDVVLRKYRTCIFVNGCFWHGHRLGDEVKEWKSERVKEFMALQNSECCKIPKTNRDFWVRKIVRNKQRDIEVQRQLAQMGWHCITVWECDLKTDRREQTLANLAFTLNHIYLQDHSIHKPMRYTLPEESVPAIAAEERRH